MRKWVGGIGWLVVTTRPDLAYSHCRLSQMLSSPTHGTILVPPGVWYLIRQQRPTPEGWEIVTD